MNLGTRRRTRAVLAALALVGIAAVVDAVTVVRADRWNARIASNETIVDGPDLPREARFAQAAAQAASGALDGALNRYRALQEADTPLAEAARYNSGNLLMRQAAEVRAGPQPGQAIPLVELAKEHYREVLRRNPAHWDARYNLERAQRLLPDPDDGAADTAQPPEKAERAATTMRGYSPGLP